MNFDEPAHLQQLRTDLRRYFAELMDDDTRVALADRSTSAATTRRLVRRLGADGWLGIGWPLEYGGGGWGPMAQLVLFDEVLRAGAPYPLVTINTVGPALMRYGTDEQRQRFLPGILRGEIHFAIGYTEPQAGTDLAALRTRAVRDGERYIVNGNKVFTSGMDVADWVWLACRTDPDAAKHAGISILLVDATSQGVSWTPIETIGGVLTSASYYDDVDVPVADLVGGEGEGWRIITTQLNHERVTLGANSGLAYELLDGVRGWAATTPAPWLDRDDRNDRDRAGLETEPGSVVLDESWVRHDLARAHARLEAVRLLNWRMASAMENGDPGPAQSSLVKVFATESLIEVYRLLLGIVGTAGHLPFGSPGAVLAGRLERAGRQAQVNTFGGGVNEVQREILVSHALGVRGRPRSPRPVDDKPSAASSPAEPSIASDSAPPTPRRPRPSIIDDNRFFFDGARNGRLLMQRCARCEEITHPPTPACPHCQSLEHEHVECTGGGTVFSFIVNHHPQVPGFEYPLIVAVVELDEGARLVTNLVGVEPEAVRVGLPVEVEFVATDDELTLPMFRPSRDEDSDGL